MLHSRSNTTVDVQKQLTFVSCFRSYRKIKSILSYNSQTNQLNDKICSSTKKQTTPIAVEMNMKINRNNIATRERLVMCFKILYSKNEHHDNEIHEDAMHAIGSQIVLLLSRPLPKSNCISNKRSSVFDSADYEPMNLSRVDLT